MAIYLPLFLAISYACATRVNQQGSCPINIEQVSRAFCVRGACVPSAKITMVVRAFAKSADPQLEVLGTHAVLGDPAGAEGPRRVWVLIGCKASASCLPFYVQVVDPPESLTKASASSFEVQQKKHGTGQLAVVVPQGTRATLDIERDRSSIRVQVITLEKGRIGDQVRVREIDRHHEYRGTLVGPNLLREE